TVEFIRDSVDRLHDELDLVLRDLTVEQLHYQPAGKVNHIAFNIWHLARTEDNVIQRTLQRKPTIWMSDGLDKKFGIDPIAQGTGMSAEDAGNISLPSAVAFLEYMRQVWLAADSYLTSINDSNLAEVKSLGRMGEMTVQRLLGQVIITHGFEHLGEIRYIRGLQGLTGAAI
ncbi:MAG: DinB family protein, partial [Dehalococcoidia bacterium]|nr:DinB family protein [Dehalococcoidia bacterium]